MTEEKQQYLKELKKMLGSGANSEETYRELVAHIEEQVRDGMISGKSESQALKEALQALGDPEKLAGSVTSWKVPRRQMVMNLFIGCNYLFFLGGVVLMIFSHALDLPTFHLVWESLTGLSGLILVCYTLFWFYLGYEVGKQFGPKGKSLMNRTVLMSLIPNVLLMFLTLFKFIPMRLFNSMLTPEFVTLCVIATVLFYPISKAAYKIGVVQGI